MKRLFFSAVFVVLAVFCHGQNNPRVVVIPLENRTGESHRDDTETLTELLVNFINETQRFSVIDRGALSAMMTAQRWQMDDWADEEKTAEMGRVLNAQFIVRGTVSVLGTNLVVSASVQLANMNEAYGKMEGFARDITRNMETASLPDATAAEQGQGETMEGKKPAKETSIDNEGKWFNSLFYLGFQFRAGIGPSAPVTTGLVFDFCPLRWLTVSIDPSFGYDIRLSALRFLMPMLLRLGYKFEKVDFTGNIGYTIGEGFTLGTTIGFRPKKKGSFFMELAYTIPSFFSFSLGAKYGLGTRKW